MRSHKVSQALLVEGPSEWVEGELWQNPRQKEQMDVLSILGSSELICLMDQFRFPCVPGLLRC